MQTLEAIRVSEWWARNSIKNIVLTNVQKILNKLGISKTFIKKEIHKINSCDKNLISNVL